MIASPGQRKYRAIATALREAIERGDYPPGSRLPGENDIMRDYQVARMTARQALAVLISEGRAVARKGAGVYVRDFRPVVRDGITRLAGTWADGRSIWSADIEDRDLTVDHVEVTREEPPARIRILLDLPDDEHQSVVRRRRFVLDGKPVLLSASYLPADIAAGTRIEQPDTGPGGTYARLADVGYAPARFREDLRARMPEPDETERLSLPAGTPVVEIARIAYTATGRIVEVNEMIADASAYIFRYDFGTE
ncbi:MAG TPA: GntR family transcriptional regulator [Streptosporangiaceae bacterium]|nr:GntR family transcriptional regulator [Streptosporangiaceae bacterium]